MTDTVFALGAGASVVGVDVTSIEPPEAAALPRVGFFRDVAAEGILSLEPTLVLASHEAGPPSAMEQLRAAGVEVEVVRTDGNLDGARNLVRAVARRLDRGERGEALVAALDRGIEEARALRPETAPRVLFLYGRGAGTVFVAGRETSADSMIELAGGRNAATGFDGFAPFTPEAVVEAAPEVLLMQRRGLESLGGVDGVLALPGVAETPAGKSRRIIAIEDLALLGFGHRTGSGAVELARALRAAESGS